MGFYQRVGEVPPKRHTQFRRPDGGLYYEELVGEEGLQTWPRPKAARARAHFTSFGTSSVVEPVEDLVSLGLLPSPDRIST